MAIGTRPRSVAILGTLNIIYGGLCLLVNLGNLGDLLVGTGSGHRPVGRAIDASAVMWGWALTWSSIGLVAAGALFASGLGLLRGRYRGLKLAVDYALFYGILTSVVGVAITLLFGSAPLFEAFLRTRRPDQLAEATSQLIFVLLEVGPSATYSIILLLVLRRSGVIASLS